MDTENIQKKIVTNVYDITSEKKVPLHKHTEHDEVFYCLGGKGFGVLEDSEVELEAGKGFVVHADVLHSLRTDDSFYVASFLIPLTEDIKGESFKGENKENRREEGSKDSEVSQNGSGDGETKDDSSGMGSKGGTQQL